MVFLDMKSLVYFTIIVALSVALIAVCIDAYAAPKNTSDQNVTSYCEKPSVTTASGSFVKREAFCSGDLIFEDNFDKLDLEKWQHEHTLGGGGNGEFQYYLNSRQNSYVEHGILFIRPTLLADETGEEFLISGSLNIHGGSPGDYCTNPAWNGCERLGTEDNILNPVKSARVRTVNSFNFKYGKVEIRAKTPTGDWLWPALWLMPKLNQYGTWPASGEIDLMESRGNPKYYNSNGTHIGMEQVGSTLHFGPNPGLNGFETATAVRNSSPGNGFNKEFHRYQLEWTPEFMKFSVDDEQLLLVEGNFWERGSFEERAPGTPNPWISGEEMAPFDEEFYIIMNLAVGGSNGYFPDNANNNGKVKPWANNSTTAMKEFWTAKDSWLPSWKLAEQRSKEASLQVDYVKVWAL
ncbi:beta-1,3-glucan-binding protein-like [Topomyia yanbarensis]|uniref:beta-1,3-glucan-binding protein-like n=1 Tax=Topomyia yanbarensis TaxID=2498891 RepID=UPI00273AC9CE|nr:beta-1,3-glucan-binding protein-like [Topomyia yanbarensis]